MTFSGGKPLPLEAKKLVVSVKQYFDRNKIEPMEPSTKRAADALGTGINSFTKVYSLTLCPQGEPTG